jgi:hypothetical protein
MSSEPTNGVQNNPSVEVGELTVGEMRALEGLRSASDTIVREIGSFEVRKSQLLARLAQYEAQAQGVLQGAAKRLNIPQGETWHVTPEGKVRKGSTLPDAS